MDDMECDSWNELQRLRLKCLEFLRSSNFNRETLPNIDERVVELVEFQKLLGELWKRLEMDARKGEMNAPLKHTRALENRSFEMMPFYWIASALCSNGDENLK